MVADENKVVEGRDIDVVIRARPLLAHELENNYFEVIHSQKHTFHYMDPSLTLKKEARLKTDANKVDYSFYQTDSNEMVYQSIIHPLIDKSLKGGLCSLFTYG